jgi:hypothetical protein
MSNDFTDQAASPAIVQDSSRSRPRYFDGKFLTASDLMKEQAYLLRRQEDIAATLGFGVVSGLEVSPKNGTPHTLLINAGAGVTPDGDLVSLPTGAEVDLSKVPQVIALNAAFGLSQQAQQPFGQLNGLYIVGLRAVEYTANPVPGYPASIGTAAISQDGEIIEATAVTLVPYESAASQLPRAAARSRAAREIFLEQKIPKLPAGVLPLAMVHLSGSALSWVDSWLVRREVGDDERFGFGFAPRALAEAHYRHYMDRLSGLQLPADPSKFPAKSAFEILPPCGRLPDGILRSTDFTQAFFPPEAKVQLALIPEDELPALLEQSMELPPLDLSLTPDNDDALSVFILAPVKRSDYADQWDTLRLPRTVTSVAPSAIGQLRPIDALLRLNQSLSTRTRVIIDRSLIMPRVPVNSQAILDGRWTAILSRVPHLWYARIRSLPDTSALASTPIVLAGPNLAAQDAAVATFIVSEALQQRYLFVRMLADAAAHVRIVRTLQVLSTTGNPFAAHIYLAALIYASQAGQDTASQIPPDQLVKLGLTSPAPLTESTARGVENQASLTALTAFTQTLSTVAPNLLAQLPQRSALSNSGVLGRLFQMSLRYPTRPEFATLLTNLGPALAANDPAKIAALVGALVQTLPV